jgi:hypothetical protein
MKLALVVASIALGLCALPGCHPPNPNGVKYWHRGLGRAPYEVRFQFVAWPGIGDHFELRLIPEYGHECERYRLIQASGEVGGSLPAGGEAISSFTLPSKAFTPTYISGCDCSEMTLAYCHVLLSVREPSRLRGLTDVHLRLRAAIEADGRVTKVESEGPLIVGEWRGLLSR